jgi:hypothetical protein
MAIITQYRTWNGIQTKQEVNTETGEIEVFAIGSGLFGVDVLIASSEGKGSDWKLNNPQSFTDVYNRRNNTRSSVKEVQRAFFLEGYKVFNNDRAAVLNNSENYDDQREGIIARQRFFNQGTPLLVDPSTQKEVNLEGEKTTQPVTPPVTVEDNQTERQEDAPPSSSTANGEVITADNPVVKKEGDSKDISKKTESTPKPKFESVGVLRYPLANLEVVEDITGITYDYIKITIQDWVSSIGAGKVVNNKGTFNGVSAVSRYKETKGSLGTIILPMTNGLGTQNGISWGESNGNSIELALLSSVGDLLKNVTKEDNLQSKFEAAKGVLGKSFETAKGFVDQITGSEKDAIAALLSGYVVGNTSFATRQSGRTINPNMELLFSGPKLRSFGFQFEFAPRFREEAEQVREIIKTFKKFSAPVIETTGSIFLRTPKIFQLEYIYNGDGSDTADGNTHPYLNKIKPCALTNVGVNYTPGNTYMTYADGGSMVQTTLTLSFSELEPIYDIDYTGENDHPTGY